MEFRFVFFTVISALLVATVYSSSYMYQVFVEAVIMDGISCSPQDNGKTYCCANIWDGKPLSPNITYCTTCDDTKPPSNCTERERPLVEDNPGGDLSNVLEGGAAKGGVFEEPEDNGMTFSENVAPKSGGIIEEPEETEKTFTEKNNTDD